MDPSKRIFEPTNDMNRTNKRARQDHHDGNRPRNYEDTGRNQPYSRDGNPKRQRRYDTRPPNQSRESDQERSWRLIRKNIVQIQEFKAQSNQFKEDLDAFVDKVLAEIENDTLKKSSLQNLFMQCIARLPLNHAMYAECIAKIHTKMGSFGKELAQIIYERIHKDIQILGSYKIKEDDTMQEESDILTKNQDFDGIHVRIRLLFRFLGYLTILNVVNANEFMQQLSTIQDAVLVACQMNAMEASRDMYHTRMAWGDYFCGVVLETITHCGNALSAACDDSLHALLNKVAAYMTQRENALAGSTNWIVCCNRLSLLYESENEEDIAQFCKSVDVLSLLYESAQESRKSESQNDILGMKALTEIAEGAMMDDDTSKWMLPAFNLDWNKLQRGNLRPYKPFFRILTEDAGAIGTYVSNLSWTCQVTARLLFHDIMTTFSTKPELAAKQLLLACQEMNEEMDTEDNKSKMEYVLLETLLVLMLQSISPARLAYYDAILYHFFKAEPAKFSPAFAILVELLFREVSVMNCTALTAFIQMFSHFLSNFEYEWRWMHWKHVLEESEDEPQRLFVSAVIEKCVRLSYLDHMQKILPAEMHVLLPPSPQITIPYANEDTTLSPSSISAESIALFEAIQEKLKAHPPIAALKSFLTEHTETNDSILIETFVTAFLKLGTATFTHLRLLLEKYLEIFTDLALFQPMQSQLCIIQSVNNVWQRSPQHIEIILNMMLRHGVFHADAIAHWIFTPHVTQQYSWPYIWTILTDTMTYLISQSSDSEQSKNLMQFIFQTFHTKILEHKQQSQENGAVIKDNWYISALGQIKAFGIRFHKTFLSIAPNLENTFVDKDVCHIVFILQNAI